MYRHCPIITAVTGFIILVTGVVCTWYAFPSLIESQIDQSIAMREGTTAFEAWKKQPFPILFKIYLFNVSNPSGVMAGERPILKELGPYVYKIDVERTNAEIDEAEDTVRYFLKKTFHFDQKMSGCRTEDDTVTVLNAALMGTVLQIQSMMPSAVSMITDAYPYLYPGTTDMFLRTSVRELLFGGITLHCTAPEIDFICGTMKGFLPQTVTVAENGKDFEFSMFGFMNKTLVGPYVMQRGMKVNSTRGELLTYMDEELMDVWTGNGCNMINGSDTGLYFTMTKPVKKIYTYTADVCRSVFVTFENNVEFNGLNAFRYSAPAEAIAQTPESMCFCAEGDEPGEYNCPPNGLVDLSPCLKAPVLLSFPHFYLADKSLLDFPIGLKPNKDLHESFLVIEPMTATPLAGSKRVQMSILLKKVEEFPLLENVSEGVFPILWLDETVVLPNDFLEFIVTNFKKIGLLSVVKWILIAVGISLMLLSFVLVMYEEKLMCFAETGKVFVSNGHVNPDINSTTDIQFNSTVMYPSIYAQMESRNANDNFGKSRQQFNQNAWQMKI